MEDSDAVTEDTGQRLASPNHHQKPDNSVLDDFIKKIVDDLVPTPAGAVESKHPSHDGVDESHATDETAAPPQTARRRNRHRASSATIDASRTATLRTECVATRDSTLSAHDLRLCETTPSTVALSSRPSLNSLVSGQSASMQTIFHTPDWVDDDSDCCKFSEKTYSSARRPRRRKRDVDSEAALPARGGNSTDVDGKAESAELPPVAILVANPCLPAANFGEEQKEMFDLDDFDRLATDVNRDTPGKESTRSAIEEKVRDFSEVREFDPLLAPVVDPLNALFGQTDVKIDDFIDGSLGNGVEPAAQDPVVVMQFSIVHNPGAAEFQQTANTPQDSDDMIQFDNLPVNVTHEEDNSTTPEEPLVSNEVINVERMLKFCPSPPTGPMHEESELQTQTLARPVQLQTDEQSGLIKFRQSINQLKDYRDQNCTGQSEPIIPDAETVYDKTRTNIDELVSALRDTGTSESQMSPPLSSSSDLGGLAVSQGHGTTGAHEQRLEAETPLEQAQRPNDSARESQRLDQTQESCDLMSFSNSGESRTTEDTSDVVTSHHMLDEMYHPGQTIPLSTSPSRTVSNDTDSRHPEKTQGIQQECLDHSGTPAAETLQVHDVDEIEIELKRTSSEIRTIKMSSSALLQDFYDLRKTYAAELTRSSQSIARTAAERDSRHCLDDAHRDGQSKRIDSAIDLMDATIDEIQKWQMRRRGTPPERDPGTQEAAAAKSKPAEVVVRSATVPSTPAMGPGPTANKPALGNVLKRDAKLYARAEPSRIARPMTSNIPNRSLDARGRGGQAVSPRRDLLANQTKRPSGDVKSPYVAASKRVQSVRPSVNIPADRLQKSPSAVRFGRAKTAKVQTPEEAFHELQQCTLSPATYLKRCLALAQSDAGKAKRDKPQEETSTKGWTKRAPQQRETLDKKSDAAAVVVVAPLATAAAKNTAKPNVWEPKEIKIPQVRVEISNKGTNVSKEAVVKAEGPQPAATKPKNRFLSDDDIEKWVKLSTRYARCAELGASLFSSKHSCVGDKEAAVKSDGSLVQTASDLLMDTLMDTVVSAVNQSASVRPKSRPTTGKPGKPTGTAAAKDILSKLSDGDTRCVTHLKTVEKVTRSIDNVVRSMSEIVDSTSDKRVCWDSSLDSLPTAPAERDAGVDEVQEEIVEKSRQVVEKMTDTLIKHLGNVPDELDFKTVDDVEAVTLLSMEDLLEQPKPKPKSAESLRRWSDAKPSQLEAILSRLMQTHSTTSAWGLGGAVDADAIPESVRNSRHKLATLENIVALLNGINTTCRSRENNVEWDDPVDGPQLPSMAPLPDKSKWPAKGNRGGLLGKNLRDERSGKKSVSLSNTSSKRPSQSVVDNRKQPTSPKSPDDTRRSDVDVGKRQGHSISQTSAHERSPSATSSELGASTRSARCEACVDKARRTKKSERRRSANNASTGSRSSQASVKSTSRAESPKPRTRRSDSSHDVDAAKNDILSYCGTCDAKRKKAKLAEERGETTQTPAKRLSSATSKRRERSLSPTTRRGSSMSSGSSSVQEGGVTRRQLSYCDTCDEKRRQAALAEERGEITQTPAKRLSSATSKRRERSLSPTTRRGSSMSSGSSSVQEGGVTRRQLSYCDTCDEKRRQAALAEERGETETKPLRRPASKSSARGRDSSVSSTSSLEDAASRRPRYSYCDTCDEQLRKQTPPATPLKVRDGRRGGSWRSDSTQDLDVAIARPRVMFSPPLTLSEHRREAATSARREAGRTPRPSNSAVKERMYLPTERIGRPLRPLSIVHHLGETDSVMSNLSASLSRDSTSGNYSSATFIISDRPSRRTRVDLALPKIRHVEGTRSTYKHVLQKAFMDRLDNIIKVQSANSRVNLTTKPSATSSTSMARYTMRSVQLSSSDKYKMRHHIPTATEIRARMKRCCDRMPSADLFGVAISRESLVRRSSQCVAVASQQSLGFLDDVDNVEDLVQRSARPASCNKALSATYTNVIRRDRPALGSTRISRKIQSFIRRDLSSWDKITNECIQSVRRNESILQIAAASATSQVLPSSSSRFNKSEESLLLALIAALGGRPRNNPTLTASSVVKETLEALRRNKKYRQRDDLEQDEVAIPIAHLCSSETLFKTINAVLKTDTEASVTPVESRSFDLESRSSGTDSDKRTYDSYTEHVFKPVTSSFSDSVRNFEMESVESITVCRRDGSKTSKTQCHQVLENVGQFSYSPPENESDTSAAVSSSDVEEVEGRKDEGRDFEKVADILAAASQDAEISGAKSDDHELKNVTKCGDATSEGDMSSAENVAYFEDARTATSDSSASMNTASCDATSTSESIHTVPGPVGVQLSSKTDVSSESLQNITYYVTKIVKEDRISKMKCEVMNNSCKEEGNDSCCSIPELLERFELAMPFQHERLAIETDSGMSIPIVDAVTEETMQKLHHAISHLPQQSFNTGDEIFSRHHHPDLPLGIRADLELYNECQTNESPYQNHKTGNRTRNAREGICGMRQTKSLLADKPEPKVGEESRRRIEEPDAIVAGSGDTDANESCSESDGASLIVNVSTEVCATDSVADRSLLDASCSSILTTQSTASTSQDTLASTSDDASVSTPEESWISAENEILVELLDQVNTRSQLDVLNSRLEGVVRRERLVEDVVEPRALEWRGTNTVSAVCLTFGAVVVGAVLGLPNLWE